MATIRKTIVRDNEERPVAVQIDYADWLRIEKLLADGTEIETVPGVSSIDSYSGCLKLTEDPLHYQIRIRGEWG